MGPVGPQGPPGQPGSEGLRGIPGAAVSIFRSWQTVDRGMKKNRLQINAISCCMEKNANISNKVPSQKIKLLYNVKRV